MNTLHIWRVCAIRGASGASALCENIVTILRNCHFYCSIKKNNKQANKTNHNPQKLYIFCVHSQCNKLSRHTPYIYSINILRLRYVYTASQPRFSRSRILHSTYMYTVNKSIKLSPFSVFEHFFFFANLSVYAKRSNFSWTKILFLSSQYLIF